MLIFYKLRSSRAPATYIPCRKPRSLVYFLINCGAINKTNLHKMCSLISRQPPQTKACHHAKQQKHETLAAPLLVINNKTRSLPPLRPRFIFIYIHWEIMGEREANNGSTVLRLRTFFLLIFITSWFKHMNDCSHLHTTTSDHSIFNFFRLEDHNVTGIFRPLSTQSFYFILWLFERSLA